MTPPSAAAAFLAEAGWGSAVVVPLAGDASFRRYFRVIDEGRQAVLMDAPPPHEDARPFVDIARHLEGLGFAAPRVLALDLNAGLVLLEDFGDDRMREALDIDPGRERDLYGRAVALLAALHRTAPASIPEYSRAELWREASLLVDWYCPAVDLEVDREGYRTVWHQAFERIAAAPPVTVLRDYHAENIMLREGEGGHRYLGLLDFQDALVGHPAYDLVSLLQDARRDVPVEVEAFGLAAYGDATGIGTDFTTAYRILGAQRNAKILGIFTRLWKRDGKPRYLTLMPRVWAYLERDLADPALAEVAAWFDANVPPAMRGARWRQD